MEARKAVTKWLEAMAEITMKDAQEMREKEPERSFWSWRVSEEFKKAAQDLERMTPAETEMEGGGSSWYITCGECHGVIDENDHFCKHCGRAVKWK